LCVSNSLDVYVLLVLLNYDLVVICHRLREGSGDAVVVHARCEYNQVTRDNKSANSDGVACLEVITNSSGHSGHTGRRWASLTFKYGVSTEYLSSPPNRDKTLVKRTALWRFHRQPRSRLRIAERSAGAHKHTRAPSLVQVGDIAQDGEEIETITVYMYPSTLSTYRVRVIMRTVVPSSS
jgi:hypothetical protein